jgi:hypothetical protein
VIVDTKSERTGWLLGSTLLYNQCTMTRDIVLTKFQIWFLLTIAFACSYWIAISVAGGWVGITVLVYYGILYGVTSLVFLLVAYLSERTLVHLNKQTLLLLFFNFFLFLILTPSDCGDASGKYTHLYRLIDNLFSDGSNVCGESSSISILNSLYVVSLFFHVGSLLLFLRQISKGNSAVVKPQGFYKLLFIVALSLAGLWTLIVYPMVYASNQKSAPYKEWAHNQTQIAEDYVSYPFVILPPRGGCKKDPLTSSIEVLELANNNGLSQPQNGHWQLVYYYGLSSKECLWHISAMEPSATKGSLHYKEEMYINDITKAFIIQ